MGQASQWNTLSCLKASIRHNEIRNFTADLLTEVCPDVCIEPNLQPLSGETFPALSTNTSREARADISVNGVWGSKFEKTFLDVGVFNPYATSYSSTNISTIVALERLNMQLLTGGMARECRLATMISEKKMKKLIVSLLAGSGVLCHSHCCVPPFSVCEVHALPVTPLVGSQLTYSVAEAHVGE